MESLGEDKLSRKILFGLAIVLNLSGLIVFKYSNFILRNIESVANYMGYDFTLEKTAFVIPLGISFFCFSIVSYVIDVYTGKVHAEKNIINFSLYIFLFPKLVMGPIVRYSDISNELYARTMKSRDVYDGMLRFIRAVGKKVLLANQVGTIADAAFGLQGGNNFVIAWVGAIAYALQIYLDFSSYSDMAIGLGRIFGFTFAENFNNPYMSVSIKDFWRRWHITLSTWFRDYIYIPLGGSRKCQWKTYRNLGIVFFVTGVWHGASWNFIIWGIYHGLFMILERGKWGIWMEKSHRALKHVYTMLVVIVGWVFFRADNIVVAISYLKSMFVFNLQDMWQLKFWAQISLETVTYIVISVFLCVPLSDRVGKKINYIVKDAFAIIIFIVSIYYLLARNFNPFIYLKF